MDNRRHRAGSPITPQELEQLSDEQLAKMDYYIDGVVGKVPTGN